MNTNITQPHALTVQIQELAFSKDSLSSDDKAKIRALANNALNIGVDKFSASDRIVISNKFNEWGKLVNAEDKEICEKVNQQFGKKLTESSGSEELSQQGLTQDLQPFFDLVKPEENNQELKTILIKLNSEGHIKKIEKTGENKYKITLDQKRDLTYTRGGGVLSLSIGTISISQVTEITLHPTEHGHSNSEPHKQTNQRRVSFDPPIEVSLSGLFQGKVKSLATDHYINKNGKDRSNFEVSPEGLPVIRIAADELIPHLRHINWEH